MRNKVIIRCVFCKINKVSKKQAPKEMQLCVSCFKSKKLGGKEKPSKRAIIYKEKMEERKVYKRARYLALSVYKSTCMVCGSKAPEVPINVDHIKPKTIYPKLLCDPMNLQILCNDCNNGKHYVCEKDFRTREDKLNMWNSIKLLKKGDPLRNHLESKGFNYFCLADGLP